MSAATSTGQHNANLHSTAKVLKAQRLSRQQVASDKNTLDAYNRANGSMPVARRTAVVVPALENVGYSRKDATEIALDAPLNASMYDDAAILTSLRYAKSISQPLASGEAPNITQIGHPTVIPMPKKASAAYDAATQDTTDTTTLPQSIVMPPQAQTTLDLQEARSDRFGAARSNVFNNLSRIIGRARQTATPAANWLANLPSPGGIGGLFFLNLLFLAAIVPANPQGYTRLQLLWYTLLNQTDMPTQAVPEIVPPSPTWQALESLAAAQYYNAIAVASLGKDAQNVINSIESAGSAVATGLSAGNPIFGGILGGIGSAVKSVTGSGTGGSPVVQPPGNGGGPVSPQQQQQQNRADAAGVPPPPISRPTAPPPLR